MYRLLQHKEKTRSYVVPMLGNLANWDPFMLKKKPSLGAALEEQEPQTEDPSLHSPTIFIVSSTL